MTELHPAYKEAAKQIVERVEAEGYGFIIAHEDLREMLRIEFPHSSKGYDAYKAWSFAICDDVESLRDLLLDEHNIYIMNIRGIGYQVLSPDEQIRKGYMKHVHKMTAQLNKALKTLVNVNQHMLSAEEEKERQEKLIKMTFIRKAVNKRKIIPFDPKRQKELECK